MNIIDPLAQSFYVDEESGIFVTSIDLYFFSKDDNIPVTVQLRPIELGLPTNKIYPFSEVVIDPKDVNISDDATVPTKVTFESPIYLTGQRFHSVVILSNSDRYNVWVSRLGEFDVTSASNSNSNQILVTNQPLSGGLFKSQNSITWNESPYEDLKFTLYRANFTTRSGNLNFYNSELSVGNNQIAKLLPNSLEFSSKKIRVGLGTTLQDSALTFGNTIIQQSTNASGNYVESAGVASGDMRIINAGIGYTPSNGTLTFNNISLTNITGTGKDATANITITNGVAVGATINNGGTGYTIGDILTAPKIGDDFLGKNIQLSVQSLSGVNELIVDNVQGEFESGGVKILQYINNSEVTTDLNFSVGGNVTIPANGIIVESDGLNIKVNHKNHGMHAGENTVKISNVVSDIKPSKLTVGFDASSTSEINLDPPLSNFTTFENVSVSNLNPGYIIIGSEIIAYEGVSGNTLTGITRGIDQTTSSSHAQGATVYKYELNGISLRRINATHTLQDATVDSPIDLDYYNIKIDTSQAGKIDSLPLGQVDRSVGITYPKLFANETKSTGGNSIHATQNIQYEIVRPNIQTLTLNGTSISAKMRTISGTSVGGNESSFADKGFSDISLNKNNYFDSPRIICSKENEITRLDNIPANKSLNVNFNLISTNSFISPVVDLDRVGMIFTTNRVNNAVENYSTDNRVNTLLEDPSAFVYATKSISLEFPATSIKLIVSAHINEYNDMRALYSIQEDPSESPIFYTFPGYLNVNSSTGIDMSLNDGTPDKKVQKSASLGFASNEIDFKEYEFNIDSLSPFKYFSIKLIGTSTNQAFPPRLKDLRVIALA